MDALLCGEIVDTVVDDHGWVKVVDQHLGLRNVSPEHRILESQSSNRASHLPTQENAVHTSRQPTSVKWHDQRRQHVNVALITHATQPGAEPLPEALQIRER